MTTKLAVCIQRIQRIGHLVEDGLLIILLAAMIFFAVNQIFLRNFFASGITWADPLLRILVLWVGLVGAMVATRQKNHIAIDALTRFLSAGQKLMASIFVDSFTAVISGIIAYHAYRFVMDEQQAGTFAFAKVPAWICELILPIAFALIAWRYFIYAIDAVRQLFLTRHES